MKAVKGSSYNRSVLRTLTLLAIISGVVIVALFYGLSMNYVHRQSHSTLSEFTQVHSRGSGKHFPEVFFVSTDESGDDLLTEAEQALVDVYLAKRDRLPFEEIRRFSFRGDTLYYFPRAIEGENATLLIYVDVSFTVDLIRSTTLALSAVVALLTMILIAADRRTARMLDAKDESLKNFFANASHELKTPLMAISGYAQGMEAGLIAMPEACEVIGRETERMQSLIGNILEFSKVDSGMVEPHFAINDVREILYDAMSVVRPVLEQKGAELRFELSEPIMYSCDEDMLFSVFSNLLTNGARYAQTCICVQATLSPDGKRLCIRVCDDGRPMAQETAEHLFDRFYKGPGGQTGIGMALSKEYVNLHHGTINTFRYKDMNIFEVRI